jgi:hypothetical protein
MKRSAIVLILLAGALLAGTDLGTVRVSHDGVPQTMNLQGFLTDTLGNPVSGSKSMVFRILRFGSPVWQESQVCTLELGLFQAVLGTIIPIPFSVFEPGTACDFQLAVEGQTLSPNVPVTSTGYAFRCVKADSALYAPSSGGVTSVGQAAGITCVPNPITASGTVGINRAYLDTVYVRNQGASAQNADFWIDGAGVAQQLAATSATTNAPAVWGDGSTCGDGVFGETNGSLLGGAFGVNRNSSGTGVVGAGNDGQAQVLTQGSGGAFTGEKCGVVGYAASSTALPMFGAYFLANGPPDNYSYLALWDAAGYGYRCYGNGDCAQGALTRDGVRTVFSTVGPSPAIEDRGRARLSSGHCRVDMDARFLDCVTVTDASPLDVFIQPNGDCKGVYVKTDAAGFDVYELQHGSSSVEFTWRAVAPTRGHDLVRFPASPETPDLTAAAGATRLVRSSK